MSTNTMSDWLANVYKTEPQTAEIETTEKNAHAELFAKLAAERGIDLSRLPPEQVADLYERTFPGEKLAGEMPPQFAAAAAKKDDDKDEKKDDEDEEEKKAQAYFLEKRAFAAEVEKADLMGRIMAHAFIQETEKHAAAKQAGAAKVAGEMPPQFAAAKKDEGEKKEKKSDEEEKKAAAQAFESVAMKHAVKIAHAAGLGTAEDIARRVEAASVLGLVGESEKIAHATTAEAGVHIRALEYLEAAKYQVNWDEVFGQG